MKWSAQEASTREQQAFLVFYMLKHSPSEIHSAYMMDAEGDMKHYWGLWQGLKEELEHPPYNENRHDSDCASIPPTCLRCFVEDCYRVADSIKSVPGQETNTSLYQAMRKWMARKDDK